MLGMNECFDEVSVMSIEMIGDDLLRVSIV